MTQIQIDQPHNRSPQIQPTVAPNLRVARENGAGAFDELFAEKSVVELDRGANTSSDDVRESREEEPNAPSPDEETAEDSTDTNDSGDSTETNETSPDTTAQSSGEPAGKPSDQASGPEQPAVVPESTPNADTEVHTGDVQPEVATGEPGTAAQPIAEVPSTDRAAPVTGQEQVRQELRDAASVDLASLAREELLGAAPKPAGSAQGASKAAERTEDQPRPTLPTPRAESGGAQSAASPPAPHDGSKPTPGFTPSVFRPDSAATTQAASLHPSGKNPSVGDPPLSAPGQQRHLGNGNGAGADAALRVDAAASKAVFLERLANASGGRRGAVSAAERTVATDRVLTTAESKATAHRTVGFKPIDQPPPTRDAFLAPVQKGLGRMLSQGGGQLTVMLRPQELGDVRIQMQTRQGAVQVRMEVSSDAARQALEAGLDTLRATLEARGVRVESMDISSGARADGADPDTGSDNRGRHHEHAQQDDSQRRREPPGAGSSPIGLTESQADQLWTELGIDAVA